MKSEELLKEIEKQLASTTLSAKSVNTGRVEYVGDGIVRASGLSEAGFGEEVEFETGDKGLVLGIDEDEVSIILLSNTYSLEEGMEIKTTKRLLGVIGTDDLLGRVIDPLQNALDGKALKLKGKEYPLEKIAPGVVARQPVDTPLKTGIKAIDAMIPIGRGQRQLIIGDRNTGKTAIAVDTIINQQKKDLGLKKVISIYCAIGQKRGNIAQIQGKLTEHGAMENTIIVAASASDPAAFQYLAPFTAVAIAEYFMDKGDDVLVVYDDLSKHAWAYRQISLLLKRPAGREAYPGDIFYLHSKLLERASRMADDQGGGSITAFPIIETQAGDVSAYIPTNVISITDGQIFLETDLFNSGMRPAINAGISVSRVGGAAQTKVMKQVAGPLRLDLSQFRELAAFAQFGSDLDEATLKKIERGKRVSEILKQPQYSPLSEAEQTLALFAGTKGLLDDVDVSKIRTFEEKIFNFVKSKNKKIIEKIESGDKLDDKTSEELTKIIKDCVKTLS